MKRSLEPQAHLEASTATQLGGNVAQGADWHGAAVAFALMGLCGFAFSITRGNAVRRTFATSQWMEDADIDVMLNVAKTQATRMAMFVGVCATALALFSSLPIELEARVILSVSPAMLMTIGVVALVRLQRLAAIDPDGIRVTAHGHYLFVARDKQLVGWVGASPELLARASALPTAKLHR
ncbi:MAG TPA: hypothetical protein VFV99_26130 [Kofleriaceae bacterium]|nr:hypothetical protein [Kofleriaceae bacterium]